MLLSREALMMRMTSSMLSKAIVQAFDDFQTVFGLFQIEPAAASDDVDLVLDVFLQHLFEIKDLRFAVDKSQHNNAVAVLELCMFVKLIQQDLGHHVPGGVPARCACRCGPIRPANP